MKVILLMKWFIAFIPLIFFITPPEMINNTNNVRNDHDTLAVMLLRIDEGDKIRYKRINGTKFTYNEYCELLEAIVNEGLCEVCDDNDVY